MSDEDTLVAVGAPVLGREIGFLKPLRDAVQDVDGSRVRPRWCAESPRLAAVAASGDPALSDCFTPDRTRWRLMSQFTLSRKELRSQGTVLCNHDADMRNSSGR